MPIALNGSDASSLANSEKACAKLCDARKSYGAPKERCVAWVINVPGCKAPGHASWPNSLCFLKAGGGALPKPIHNKCRISGMVSASATAVAAAAAAAAAEEAEEEIDSSSSMCTLHSLLPKPPIVHTNATAANSSSCGESHR